MRLLTLRESRLLLVALLVMLARPQAIALAQQTNWQAETGTSADWFDQVNWSDGVPAGDRDARIAGGGTASIAAGKAAALALTLELSLDSHVHQSGGRLTIADDLSIALGRYELSGGLLKSGRLWLSGPLVSIIRGGPGIVQIPVPVFSLDDDPEIVPILPDPRDGPPQRFIQTGGTLDVVDRVTITAGLLEIDSGQAYIAEALIDAGQGLFGAGRPGMAQRGGKVDFAGELVIQNGLYDLSGGELHAGKIGLGDPTMGSEPGLVEFFNRTPEFAQSGGAVRVDGNLELCMPGDILGILPIDVPPFREVTYRLESGTLDVGGDVVVGSLATAPAQFLQSGGSNTIAGTLLIEGTASVYVIESGSLSAATIQVGMDNFNEGGTLALRGAAASLSVGDRISFGRESVLEAVAGSALRLEGADFEILSQADKNFDSMNELSLVFEGGVEQISQLEVAGIDLGSAAAGFDGNFALDTLRVGSDSSANLQLVDLFDNQLEFDGTESLYVKNLVVSAGSTLDLGDINLYYVHADIAGEILGSGETAITAVPEPAAWLLSAQALMIAVWIRRKSRPKSVA